MRRSHSEQGGLSRRDFLQAGAVAAGSVGLSLTDAAAASNGPSGASCILLFLVGGPSQVDTWDMKPNAPDHIRGPFRPIQTNVAGIQICEHFPRMARMADQYAIVRSLHHESAPIHETGQQLMQTGHLFRSGQEYPHYGAVVSRLRGPRRGAPPFVILPGPLGNTGVSISHGQGAGYLGAAHEATLPPLAYARGSAFDISADDESARERYGPSAFGQSCLRARRLVEGGVRFVTVNMFDTVFNRITWDCHAEGSTLPATLEDYRRILCPMFDQAYTALLTDLHDRGMLANTLVVAMGEFGRTPRLNSRGGRDHWPGVWSILFAGGGVRGGQVIGASDRTASEPRDRPVSPAEVAATVYRTFGINPATCLPGPETRLVKIADAEPVQELFEG